MTVINVMTALLFMVYSRYIRNPNMKKHYEYFDVTRNSNMME